MTDSTFITRVQLRNYKSIGACDVRLGPLTFLVGPNGAGKSNFLDALRLVSESLTTSLDHALRDRGGVGEVRRRSGGHPTHFGVRLDFRLPSGVLGHFSFVVAAKARGAYEVQQEECSLHGPGSPSAAVAYVVKSGVVTGTIPSPPAAAADRLYLVTLSGLPELRPIYDAMSRMGFYNLSPAVMRVPHPPDAGEILTRDGHNVASVLGRLAVARPEAKHRIEEYLTQVSPGVHGVDRIAVGPMETLEFKQDVVGSRHPWTFGAINMSDGTLRALGVLVALFQGAGPRQESLRLIGIEEPETALHPAASAVLMDVLRDAADERQVLVTSHSPDLLDDASVQDGDIRAVQAEHGDTKIGLLDSAGRAALRDRLYTAGELLRMDQLQPEEAAIELKPEQLRLFGRQD